MTPSTLNSEIPLDEVLDGLAYLCATAPVRSKELRGALEIMTAGHGTWDIAELIEQVQERAKVIRAAL